MRILLDENFPLQLYRRLIEAGIEAEHIIVSGQRGIADEEIRIRVRREPDLVLMTNDTEFGEPDPELQGLVIISRVPQALPIERRVNIWVQALIPFLAQSSAGHVFEILASGAVVAVHT